MMPEIGNHVTCLARAVAIGIRTEDFQGHAPTGSHVGRWELLGSAGSATSAAASW